uniref:Vinculin n=2 Tax=Onchocercidae TaxID=6296 RepID=VINC_BRUMA|nr:RecName: Full=Vinculin [Brugia malayi]AAB96842.1 vinculin [Brugia malayi]
MPVFHTKTIEGILEPVAQQVSRLVILHEEAEDGNAVLDLTLPVGAVSRAVDNLIKVGYDTCHSSDDRILQADMPPALQRVEASSRLLEDACHMLRADPYSSVARKKLIEGARGILQGTSALLLSFDESEVRKIIRGCRKVLDYLAVAEVIESMDDLAQFVKDISPWLTRVSRNIDAREKELTHQVHREILLRCMDTVKTLSPIMICAMKIFIQITEESQRGQQEAAENRNYLAQRMTDEMNEIIRVLQLTTYDEDEWDSDNVTVMRKALSAAQSLLTSALDWLADSRGRAGATGEKAIRRIVDYSERIAARALPEDARLIRATVSDITSMTDSLCELRNQGGDSQGLASGCANRLKELVGTKEISGILPSALTNTQRTGGTHPAHTVTGRLEQALRWMDNPGVDDNGLGLQAVKAMTSEAGNLQPIYSHLQNVRKFVDLCVEIDRQADQLADLEHRGLGNPPAAHAIRNQLRNKLRELVDIMKKVITDRVVEDFADISTPLKQFVDAVYASPTIVNRELSFEEKAHNLDDHSSRCANTALLVAKCGPCKNKKTVEAIIEAANQVNAMTPQVIKAGKIRLHNDSDSANLHFDNLRREYSDVLNRLRSHVDDAIDTSDFIRASEQAMRQYTVYCENAIRNNEPQQMVDNTSQIARFGNRVLMTAKNEADNSEEPSFVHRVNNAARRLHSAIPPMVNQAKQVALNPRHGGNAQSWRDANEHLLSAVRQVGDAITGAGGSRPPSQNLLVESVPPKAPTSPIVHDRIYIREDIPTPPRPPPPVEISPPPRPPPPPETDDEEETRAFWERYPLLGASSQPILSAAHNLHQELRQWSSHENEIVAAAKRMAILMARLSQLVRGEGGTKKDLVDCAKAIADSSEEVTRLAVQLARQCTVIKMRMTLLQVCERIPTIATQLKILSTVKATMLGSQATIGPYGQPIDGSEEDEEAMQQLVLNAQNLMQSVKDTVRAAEAASIKIRTNSGLRLRWIRKPMWSNF